MKISCLPSVSVTLCSLPLLIPQLLESIDLARRLETLTVTALAPTVALTGITAPTFIATTSLAISISTSGFAFIKISRFLQNIAIFSRFFAICNSFISSLRGNIAPFHGFANL